MKCTRCGHALVRDIKGLYYCPICGCYDNDELHHALVANEKFEFEFEDEEDNSSSNNEVAYSADYFI